MRAWFAGDFERCRRSRLRGSESRSDTFWPPTRKCPIPKWTQFGFLKGSNTKQTVRGAGWLVQDKNRIGELLAASVKWPEDSDLAPLLLIDFPMHAQSRSDQMKTRLVWSPQGKEVLKEIGIDPMSLDLCPPSADCNQQIIDIKECVERNVERCVAVSIEMSARRLSLLKVGLFFYGPRGSGFLVLVHPIEHRHLSAGALSLDRPWKECLVA